MKFGEFEFHALSDGTLALDGGQMFGVVPKPLWEKRIPADARNRIPLGLRCLLVEHPDGLVLIDTGVGNVLTFTGINPSNTFGTEFFVVPSLSAINSSRN